MKVSLVVSDLAGGGAVRAFLLAQILKQLAHEVEIVGFLFGKELYAIPPDNLPIVSVPGANYPKFLAAAGTALKKINGDVVYAVKPKATSFGLSLFKKLQGRPVLLDMDDWELSWHGGDDWQYRPSVKQFARDVLKRDGALRFPDHPLYLQWMEGLVKQADAVTIDTEFLQKRFGGVYVPNGKDTALFDPSKYDPDVSRDRYGLSSYRILMFPGAPRPHKGVEDVLVALEQLNQPDLKLVIVGGSPYDNYDEQLQAKWGRWLIQLPKCPVSSFLHW